VESLQLHSGISKAGVHVTDQVAFSFDLVAWSQDQAAWALGPVAHAPDLVTQLMLLLGFHGVVEGSMTQQQIHGGSAG